MPATRTKRSKPQPVDPLQWTPYLKGKSDLFLSRIDCELEVDGIVFPIHSAIVTNASSMLDNLLESFISSSGADAGAGADGCGSAGAGTGALPRVVLKRKPPPPAAPVPTTADSAQEGGITPALPPGVAIHAAPAVPAQSSGGAAGGAPAAAAMPAAAPGESVLSPERVRLFLGHVYDGDKRVSQEADAIALLELSDFFQAKSMRMACDRALVEIAKGKGSVYGPPIALMELAAQYKLRHLMAHLMASVLVWIAQGRFGSQVVDMKSAKPYLELLGGDLKNEVIMELAQRHMVGHNDVAQLAEHFVGVIARLEWDT